MVSDRCRWNVNGRITGGEVAKKHSRPWQVALVDKIGSKPSCGGMIINSHVTLTAAHCLDLNIIDQHSLNSLPWYVVTGKHDFNELKTGDYHKICKVLLHEKWDYHSYDYDFALIYLKHDISFDYKVSPICLPDMNSNLASPDFLYEEKLQISGWGQVDPSDRRSVSDKLMVVDVTVFPDEYCKEIHAIPFTNWTRISERMICAGDREGNKDSCQGDSGGKPKSSVFSFYGLFNILNWRKINQKTRGITSYVRCRPAYVHRWAQCYVRDWHCFLGR